MRFKSKHANRLKKPVARQKHMRKWMRGERGVVQRERFLATDRKLAIRYGRAVRTFAKSTAVLATLVGESFWN